MRRSSLPSQRNKFISPLVKRDQTTKLDINSGSLKENNGLFVNSASNTGSLQTLNPRTTVLLNENDGRNLSDNKKNDVANKRIFSVVYGKPSKKKHKTWDGDGTIEVGIKTVTLKDSDGKVLGSSANIKVNELNEGSRIFVGSKEVEIIDLISGEQILNITDKRDREDDENIDNRSKRICQPKAVKTAVNCKAISRPVSTKTKSNKLPLHTNKPPLVMPRPGDQHQWEYNEQHDPVTDVVVDPNLNKHLRPHQQHGIIFLYRCITGINNIQYLGAILADEMGLGKTLQTITLIWTLLSQGPYGGRALLKKVLIVVPSSLVQNWNNEFIRWIGSYRIRLFVVDKKNKAKDYPQSNCPVIIISYDQFVRNIDDLRDIDFDLIVCDEGHRLKNSGIQATNHLSSLPCKRRILLTGTPIQNDLQEYYTLVDFVNPGILGTPAEFRKNYGNAIVASRDPNASDETVSAGKEKADELNRFTGSFILRRTQQIIGSFLPQKTEYVVFCSPSPLQRKLYSIVSRIWLERFEDKNNQNETNHLSTVTLLKKICNHPILVQNNKIDERIDIFCQIFDEELDNYDFKEIDSGKLSIVISLLETLKGTKERVVLVSNFTQTLDLFANICEKYKYNYLKFDGSTTTNKRSEIVDRFNSDNSDIYVLLLSSKAGGVGLNLIGGTRLILYDSDWNPAIDLQAMARIWREGQKNNVFIYRLLTTGTIEEKIFQRQLTKAGLSESIVDLNCKSSVKLSKEEIMDLFDFSGNDKCLTHEILKCNCLCNGTIPDDMNTIERSVVDEEENENDEMRRDCQLTLSCDSYTMPSLRMNQLYQWEHHGSPIAGNILQEMKMAQSAVVINFIFRNQTR